MKAKKTGTTTVRKTSLEESLGNFIFALKGKIEHSNSNVSMLLKQNDVLGQVKELILLLHPDSQADALSVQRAAENVMKRLWDISGTRVVGEPSVYEILSGNSWLGCGYEFYTSHFTEEDPGVENLLLGLCALVDSNRGHAFKNFFCTGMWLVEGALSTIRRDAMYNPKRRYAQT